MVGGPWGGPPLPAPPRHPPNPSSFDPIFSCGKYEMNGVKPQPDERPVASPSAGQMAARAASEAHAWPLWAV